MTDTAGEDKITSFEAMFEVVKELAAEQCRQILTVNRCLDPLAKSRTPEWFRGTALPWIMDVHPDSVNPSRIFRELEVIEGHKDAICGHLYRKLCLENPEAMQSVVRDDKGLQKAGRLDGFWLLVTNHAEQEGGEDKLSPRDAIAPCRDKVVIESAFRDIKSFIEVAPMYVWTAGG